MANLYLLNYNNYYNRIVKKENTLEDYLQYQIGDGPITGVNFIPGDDVNTTQIVNLLTLATNVNPDYLLVVEDTNTISSRWFVVETIRTRKGQLKLTLHRDLVVDYYDKIVNAPCFIEKATINNIDDPAIFNNEDMTFNQIKQAEYLLKDNSGIAWIVGYIPRDSFNSTAESDRTITTTTSYSGAQSLTVNKLSDYEYFKYQTEDFTSNATNINYGINTWCGGANAFGTIYDDLTLLLSGGGLYAGISGIQRRGTGSYNGSRTYRYTGDYSIEVAPDGNDIITIDGQKLFRNFTPTIMRQMNDNITAYTSTSTLTAFNNFMAQDGQIIFNNEDQQYYKVHVNKIADRQNNKFYIPINSGLYTLLYNNIDKTKFSGSPNGNTFQVSYNSYIYRISLELLSATVSTVIAQPNNRYHLQDSPYDMFCIPFPLVLAAGGEATTTKTIYKNGQVYISDINRNAGFDIGISVAKSTGEGNIYDVQLLPYCPIPSIIKDDGKIDIGDTLNSPITININSGGSQEGTKVVSVLLWATSSQFSIRIPFEIPESTTILDKKVNNETQFYRLCSPNYSGVFEFSSEKNGGVSYIDVDCNYKPYSPYIHMNPNFNKLYGQDFNDSRGLICGGDFSLPQVTSAWANYQLNNKNYQQMFDRQIQNMETNNAIQKTQEIASAITGTFTGGVSGLAAGAMIGGPVGAAIGGIGGLVSSAAGGVTDTLLNNKLRNEALDYTKDMYSYQLQNIKALPQGLAKVSAFTANNKIFPFIEKYGCTEIEVEALKNKLTYNGMTIMRIGSVEEFINSTNERRTYIKGRLIRLSHDVGDYHMVSAIADELYKGVFI